MEQLITPETIVRQTDKAVMIANPIFIAAKETCRHDVKELTRDEIRALQNHDSSIWLPKSQITITDGEVTHMPGWLAQRHDLDTVEAEASRKEAFENGCKAYNELLAKAKAAGVKVRSGMRKKTILAKMAEAGVAA